MKPSKSLLNRLLRGAARAPGEEPPEALPFAIETRVLARWRGGWLAEGDGEADVLALLRRGVAFACLIMVVALALSVHRFDTAATSVWTNPADEVTLTYLQ